VVGLNYGVATRLEQFNNAKDVVFDICSKNTREVVAMIKMMIWLMSNNINQWLWNQLIKKIKNGYGIMQKAKRDATQLDVQSLHMWDEWCRAQIIINRRIFDE
jgi:hypothetical protein